MEDLNSLIKIRMDKIREIREDLNINPYPYKYEVKNYSDEIINDYDNFFNSQEAVSVAGRVMAVRDMGKASFCSIQDNRGRIQLYIGNKNISEKEYKLFEKIDIGDIIGVKGTVKKTKVGEITVFITELTLLTKSIRPLPIVKEKDGMAFDLFSDKELRYRNRHVDLIVTPGVKDVFLKRLKIIKCIKDLLDKRGFLEVETPILQPIYGGAAASPFTTHHNALNMELFMRISPEPYLKRLVVGGFERVYEIGKCFRNEGIDRTHNPEFTLVELYQAYADYIDMMNITEEIIKTACREVNDSMEMKFGGAGIDLGRPWPRIKMLDAIKEYAGLDIENLSDDEIRGLLKIHGGEIKGDYVRGLAIDALFKILVEDKLIEPVFITRHPVETTPLCKPDFEDERFLQRFELFINGMEFANGYSESNDPEFQRKTLYEQSLRREIDDEAPPMDENFIQAIETGMPPAGGLGIGIDRLVMLLTGETSIRDVLFFPTMKPE